MSPKIIILGPFPPPLHGFSQANLAMRAKLEEAGFSVHAIDTAAGAGGLARIASRLKATFHLARTLAREPACFYLPVSGGAGQWADLIGVLLARLFARRTVLHHHSFAYLNRFSRVADWLFRAAGRNARHIVLGDEMKLELAKRYRVASLISVLSNSSLTEMELVESPLVDRPLTIGFLSNIVLDKGIDQFVAILERLREQGVVVEAAIAGPVVEAAAQIAVKRAEELGARYHGAVSGETKTAFFREIDVLVFPTRYVNEAEPFVIIEALAAGKPVIASRRGCIPSLIDDSCGILLDADARDLSPAIDLLTRWSKDHAVLQLARLASLKRFSTIKRDSDQALVELLAELKFG